MADVGWGVVVAEMAIMEGEIEGIARVGGIETCPTRFNKSELGSVIIFAVAETADTDEADAVDGGG